MDYYFTSPPGSPTREECKATGRFYCDSEMMGPLPSGGDRPEVYHVDCEVNGRGVDAIIECKHCHSKVAIDARLLRPELLT